MLAYQHIKEVYMQFVLKSINFILNTILILLGMMNQFNTKPLKSTGTTLLTPCSTIVTP